MRTEERLQTVIRIDGVKIWRHGDFPMPGWIPPHMVGGIEANGTFAVQTELGCTRVHTGNVIVEHCGQIWVRSYDEVPNIIREIEIIKDANVTGVGPGKSNYVKNKNDCRKNKSSKYNSKIVHTSRHLPPIGSQPSIEWIHLNRLSVDGTYQRSIDNHTSRRLIAGIANKFDWRLCAPLVVSRRSDDMLMIIDGQHRWAAACQRTDIPQLPCCIFRYKDIEEEARMFVLANRARRAINRLDDYFAALAAKDDDALEIKQLVEDAGLKISRKTSSTAWLPGEVAFTSSISKAIQRSGHAITSAVLTNMAVAFPQQKLTHGGAIFGALVGIMSKPDAEFDPDRLVTALQTRIIDEWGSHVAGVNGGDRRVTALRAAIMNVYQEACVIF